MLRYVGYIFVGLCIQLKFFGGYDNIHTINAGVEAAANVVFWPFTYIYYFHSSIGDIFFDLICIIVILNFWMSVNIGKKEST